MQLVSSEEHLPIISFCMTSQSLAQHELPELVSHPLFGEPWGLPKTQYGFRREGRVYAAFCHAGSLRQVYTNIKKDGFRSKELG